MLCISAMCTGVDWKLSWGQHVGLLVSRCQAALEDVAIGGHASLG